MGRTWLYSVSALLVMVGAGWISKPIDLEIHPGNNATGLEVHETHAGASLLGQFRTSFTSWLWLRTDLYLHNGVEMRRLSHLEMEGGKQGVGGTEPKEDNHHHDDSKIVSVIPSAKDDFRGILGDVERASKAYKDMTGHSHNDPEQALPLFRLMTWIDPEFIQGWVVGASVLARDRSSAGTRRAIDHLKEGINANPKSFALYGEVGRMLMFRDRDLTSSEPYLSKAFQFGMAKIKTFEEEDGELFVETCRLYSLNLREQGRFEESESVASKALAIFPNDPVLLRLSDPPPSILSKEDQDHWFEDREPHHDHAH